MHSKQYNGGIERLRSPERIAVLEVERAVTLSLERIRIETVLDVGTGSGLFAEMFLKQGIHASGTDLSLQMIATATAMVSKAVFTVADFNALPYRNNAFDLTFLGTVFHESDDLQMTLSEIARVTRKRIAILDWPKRPKEGIGPPLEHRFSESELAGIVLNLNLEKPKIENLNTLILYLIDLPAVSSKGSGYGR